MIIQILDQHLAFLQQRFDRQPLLHVGEDTIRYDFFCAISKISKLNSWDIRLEHAMHPNAFVPRNNEKSNRKEKPQIDLVIETDEMKLSVEFGLFRQNSNEKGNINQTNRTVKILNDFIRLATDSYYSNRKSYFVCVADNKLLGHQVRSKIIGRFPSDYVLDMQLINRQKMTKTCDFDERILTQFQNLKLQADARLFFNKPVTGKFINTETRLLAWEVLFKK